MKDGQVPARRSFRRLKEVFPDLERWGFQALGLGRQGGEGRERRQVLLVRPRGAEKGPFGREAKAPCSRSRVRMWQV